MARTTEKSLEDLVLRLNKIANTSTTPYAKNPKTDQFEAQIGNFHLDSAYGRTALHEMLSDTGGVYDVFHGHYTKREMHLLLWGFIQGLLYVQNKEREK